MADPLSAMQNTESMEDPDRVVHDALKAHRRKKRVPANIAPSAIPPSKLACALGEQMLKRALAADPQTSCKYGPAALAGIQTAKPRGARMATGNGWGNIQGSNSVTSAPGIAKMAGPLSPELMAKLTGWMSSAKDLGAAGLQAYQQADPAMKALVGAGVGGAVGGVGGGLYGLVDEKGEDEGRIGHALRRGMMGAGIGGAVGGGAAGLGALAQQKGWLKNLPGLDAVKKMIGLGGAAPAADAAAPAEAPAPAVPAAPAEATPEPIRQPPESAIADMKPGSKWLDYVRRYARPAVTAPFALPVAAFGHPDTAMAMMGLNKSSAVLAYPALAKAANQLAEGAGKALPGTAAAGAPGGMVGGTLGAGGLPTVGPKGAMPGAPSPGAGPMQSAGAPPTMAGMAKLRM